MYLQQQHPYFRLAERPGRFNRPTLRHLIGVIMMAVCHFSGLAQPLSLTLEDNRLIDRGILFLSDSSGALTLDDVGAMADRLTAADDRSLTDKAGTYWLKFVVNNNTGSDNTWVLDF